MQERPWNPSAGFRCAINSQTEEKLTATAAENEVEALGGSEGKFDVVENWKLQAGTTKLRAAGTQSCPWS